LQDFADGGFIAFADVVAMHFKIKTVEVPDDIADFVEVNAGFEPGEVEFKDLDRLFRHHLHALPDDREGKVAGIFIDQGQEIGNGSRHPVIFGDNKFRDKEGAVAIVDEPQGDAVLRDPMHQYRQGLDGIAVEFEKEIDREGAHHEGGYRQKEGEDHQKAEIDGDGCRGKE